LEWFKAIFVNGERTPPPFADATIPFVIPAIAISNTNTFIVSEVAKYDSKISFRCNYFGVEYIITLKNIYADKRIIYNNLLSHRGKMLVLSDNGNPIIVFIGPHVNFFALDNKIIGSIASSGAAFVRNNAVYVVNSGHLIENTFKTIKNKIIHQAKNVQNITNIAFQVCDGLIIQDLLGRKYISIPYALNKCLNKYIPQLDNYRIIDAKSEKNVTVIIGERGGVYNRFILVFDSNFLYFNVREVKDINYDAINFTVLETGLCVLLSNADEVELFKSNQSLKTINSPPFDSTMKLFDRNGKVFFINNDTVFSVSTIATN